MSDNYENMTLADFFAWCMRKTKTALTIMLRAFVHIACISIRRWYVLVPFFVLGIAMAWFWSKPQNSKYTGEATIVFPEGMKTVIESGIGTFFNERPEDVGLTAEVARTLKRYDIFNNIDAKNDLTVDFVDRERRIDCTDTMFSVVKNKLTIRLVMKGPSNFAAYEKAMTEYFSKQREFAVPARRWRESTQRKIDYVSAEIERTDSFINYDYFVRQKNVIVINDKKFAPPSEMHYKDMRRLVDEKEWLTEQLNATQEVINFETHFSMSTMAIYKKYLISIAVCFVIGLIIAYYIEYRAKIREYVTTVR